MPKSKKIKIKPILLSVFIGVTILFLFYLICINFLVEKKHHTILFLWENQKETSLEENVSESEDNSPSTIVMDNEDVGEDPLSYRSNYIGADRESKVDYSITNPARFFPS